MTEAEQAAEPKGPSRVRIIAARVLTVVAILLALVGMVAFYVEHTALDEQGFESISRQMIENPEIRTQVAAKSVDTLFANVDAEAAIAERLPPDLKGLAPVLAGVAQSGADDAANAALERPRVQTVWVEVSTRAQRQLVRLLDNDTTFIQTEGGAVVLDLRPLVIQIGDQVAVIGKIAEKLPESSGKVVIMQKSQLDTAQKATKVLRAVADWMWIVALALAALAVWLAKGRRRLELRAIAIGVLVVGLLMLAVRRFAGDYFVDKLVKDDAVKPAGPRGVEHPHADPRRPRLGLDHPRHRHARRSLVRRRDSSCGRCAPCGAPRLGEPRHDLRLCGRRSARARTRRSGHRPRLVVGARASRPHRRRHRGCSKRRVAGSTAGPLATASLSATDFAEVTASLASPDRFL